VRGEASPEEEERLVHISEVTYNKMEKGNNNK